MTEPDPALSAQTVSSKSVTPERNLLDSLREWTDLLPWLRLVRVTRIVGSPIWMSLVLCVYLLWEYGLTKISIFLGGESWVDVFLGTSCSPIDFLVPLTSLESDPSEVTRVMQPLSDKFHWVATAWTLALWFPVSILLIRVGAILASGHEMPSLISTLGIGLRRILPASVLAVLPVLCVMPFAVLLLIVGWMTPATGEAWWGEWITGPITFASLLLAGIVLAFGKLAVPLGVAALVSDRSVDVLDGLSRGYEYSIRRLTVLIFLTATASLITGIVAYAVWWVCEVAVAFGFSLFNDQLGIASQTWPTQTWAVHAVESLPMVAVICLGWAMVGGIYLLLRQSASGQEVEEIWDPTDHIVAPKMDSVRGD